MTIAKIFYLTSPDPGRYVINFQAFGSDELVSVEVATPQLINVILDGNTLMLRSSLHRVPVTTDNRANAEHESDRRQQPA